MKKKKSFNLRHFFFSLQSQHWVTNEHPFQLRPKRDAPKNHRRWQNRIAEAEASRGAALVKTWHFHNQRKTNNGTEAFSRWKRCFRFCPGWLWQEVPNSKRTSQTCYSRLPIGARPDIWFRLPLLWVAATHGKVYLRKHNKHGSNVHSSYGRIPVFTLISVLWNSRRRTQLVVEASWRHAIGGRVCWFFPGLKKAVTMRDEDTGKGPVLAWHSLFGSRPIDTPSPQKFRREYLLQLRYLSVSIGRTADSTS